MDEWLEAVRAAAGDRVWGAAVKLARDGGVDGVSDDGEEVHLKVKAPGKHLWHEVYLWPDEGDWGCDCGMPGSSGPDQACVHVAAAAISLERARKRGDKLPEPEVTRKVRVRYALTSHSDGLELKR